MTETAKKIAIFTKERAVVLSGLSVSLILVMVILVFQFTDKYFAIYSENKEACDIVNICARIIKLTLDVYMFFIFSKALAFMIRKKKEKL